MKQTPLEHKVTQIVQPVVEGMGLSLFCVKIIGEGGSRNVQIMAEDPATKKLDVEKCAALSRAVSAVMDVEDPINGAYRLEVSSPGIDRFLLKPEDFKTYEGFEARVETDMPTATGQRRFKGIIRKADDGTVTLDTEQGEAEIDFSMIAKAKLVLNDALLKATKPAEVA